MKLEKSREAAIRDSDKQERTRLAMWRVDFAASGLVIRENVRPPEEFRSYSPAWNELSNELGQESLPSPLLKETPVGIHLHFELDSQGNLSSPQNPIGANWALAAPHLSPPSVAPARSHFSKLRSLLGQVTTPDLAKYCLVPLASQNIGSVDTNWAALNGLAQSQEALQQSASSPASSGDIEIPSQSVVQGKLASRNQQSAQMQQAYNQQEADSRSRILKGNTGVQKRQATPTGPQSIAPFTGYWIGEELILTRLVKSGGSSVTQGIWLNWPHLKREWEQLIADILPDGRFEAVHLPSGTPAESRFLNLASLPVRLNPGSFPDAVLPGAGNARFTLIASWIAAGVAAFALALLLFRTISLSERRATFVSAVTHEMRTPLTTFRLYTEMLAKDMIPDPDSRRAYLETLHQEAGRLNHLIENVLSFARLERGSARSRVETHAVAAQLDRIAPRLTQRASEAGLELQIHVPPEAQELAWQVDVTSLEQILLNLTDNAAKYAPATKGSNKLELTVSVQGPKIQLHLRDYGPGIAAKAAKRIFTPFHKSADDAAQSAPGVGLGLSLSRRLARQMGGDLRCAVPKGPGAEFILELPIHGA
jgi:signal transduction histidine kinase